MIPAGSRWFAAIATALALTACGRTPDLQPTPRVGRQPATRLLPVFTQSVNNDIDILFLIDNSLSMEAEQNNLRRNFPVFTRVLKDLPQGLPNVHIAVVSSDLGAGRSSISHCTGAGDRGRFQSAPRGGCAGPRGSFISAVGAERNFDGDIDQAFACIAALGDQGCGFEQQLQALRVALDPQLMPPENQGFLREHAVLAMVLLTDEDDCSVPMGSALFDSGDAALQSLGPLSSFRCNEFGHLCGGRRPPRGETVTLQDCRSAEDGRLVRISELVEFFKGLKADPNDVMVAAVTGPAAPYSIRQVPVQGGRRGNASATQPEMVPSCQSANGAADPAVRIRDFVESFGNNGSLHSICADDFSPVMKRIGEEVARRASLECLGSPVADSDPDTAGVQPRCEVFDETVVEGSTVRELIPACSDAAPPCWKVQPSTRCPLSGVQMLVDRGGAAPVAGTRVHVICETCESSSDPRCRQN